MQKIFKIRGSPCTEDWPEVTMLSDYDKCKGEDFKPQPLSEKCPRLDDAGLELLEVCYY